MKLVIRFVEKSGLPFVMEASFDYISECIRFITTMVYDLSQFRNFSSVEGTIDDGKSEMIFEVDLNTNDVALRF